MEAVPADLEGGATNNAHSGAWRSRSGVKGLNNSVIKASPSAEQVPVLTSLRLCESKRKKMATPSSSTAPRSVGRTASNREGSTKAMVADQISQAVQSTSNLLHLMQQSSSSQAQLLKLPKNLLAKTSTIRNTEQILQQMPQVISSLDAHMDDASQSVPHLQTVIQLLENIESCQLKSLTKGPFSQEEPKPADQLSEAA